MDYIKKPHLRWNPDRRFGNARTHPKATGHPAFRVGGEGGV